MKKVFFCLLFITIMFNHAFSQIEKPITKGNIQIGGGGYFAYSKSPITSLFPRFGYFVLDGLVIGGEIQLIQHESTFLIGIGPYSKYYFKNGFLLNLSTLHIFGNSNILNITSGGGYAFFINNKVSLEPTLNYFYSRQKHDGEGYSNFKTNGVTLVFNFHMFL